MEKRTKKLSRATDDISSVLSMKNKIGGDSMIREEFLRLGEYAAAGLYEEPERGLFYRKALGLRRFYENCELAIYGGEHLYPSGVIEQKMNITPNYLTGLQFASSEFNEQSPHLALKLKEGSL